MAPKLPLIPIFSLLILFISSNPTVNADIDGDSLLMNGTLKWQSEAPSDLEPQFIGDEEDLHRRSLYWHAPAPTKRYYISYGALSANRIPCPARSGRSYYTHNCYRASGPVRPYSRGCSAITRCRR